MFVYLACLTSPSDRPDSDPMSALQQTQNPRHACTCMRRRRAGRVRAALARRPIDRLVRNQDQTHRPAGRHADSKCCLQKNSYIYTYPVRMCQLRYWSTPEQYYTCTDALRLACCRPIARRHAPEHEQELYAARMASARQPQWARHVTKQYPTAPAACQARFNKPERGLGHWEESQA